MSTGRPESRDLERALRAELSAAGCFRRAPLRSAAYGAAILGGYAGAYALLLASPALPLRILACAVLAFLCVHAAFLAHETAHGAVTRDRRFANGIGQFFDTVLTGLSYSYYQHTHRAHHQHTNDRVNHIGTRAFLTGGVNNHIEHHLYPSMPTARLGDARKVTRAFCHRQGIPYRETSWPAAVKEVTRHLRDMSARVPA